MNETLTPVDISIISKDLKPNNPASAEIIREIGAVGMETKDIAQKELAIEALSTFSATAIDSEIIQSLTSVMSWEFEENQKKAMRQVGLVTVSTFEEHLRVFGINQLDSVLKMPTISFSQHTAAVAEIDFIARQSMDDGQIVDIAIGVLQRYVDSENLSYGYAGHTRHEEAIILAKKSIEKLTKAKRDYLLVKRVKEALSGVLKR